jgi:hypothetical protein
MPRHRLHDSIFFRLPPYPYFLKALKTLLHAFDVVTESGKPVWESAVAWLDFQHQDIPSSALGWLMDRDIVSHSYLQKGRKQSFRQFKAHTFDDSSCFALEAKAVAQVRHWLLVVNLGLRQDRENNHAALFGLPYWKSDDSELWYEYDLVKIIPEKAANQRKVLDFCQENQWRQPFENLFKIHPDKGDCDSDTLHNALARLNANQVRRRLHFYRDGSGKRFRFEIIQPKTKTGGKSH